MKRRPLPVVIHRNRGRQRIADRLPVGRNLGGPGIGVDYARPSQRRIGSMRFLCRLARLGALGPFLGEIACRRPRRERGIALRKHAPRREQRARADDGPGDRVVALLLSDGAAQRSADDPAYHAHVSFPLINSRRPPQVPFSCPDPASCADRPPDQRSRHRHSRARARLPSMYCPSHARASRFSRPCRNRFRARAR